MEFLLSPPSVDGQQAETVFTTPPRVKGANNNNRKEDSRSKKVSCDKLDGCYEWTTNADDDTTTGEHHMKLLLSLERP